MNCARPAASLLKYDLDVELIQRVSDFIKEFGKRVDKIIDFYRYYQPNNRFIDNNGKSGLTEL